MNSLSRSFLTVGHIGTQKIKKDAEPFSYRAVSRPDFRVPLALLTVSQEF